jgi:hypothetical protein
MNAVGNDPPPQSAPSDDDFMDLNLSDLEPADIELENAVYELLQTLDRGEAGPGSDHDSCAR